MYDTAKRIFDFVVAAIGIVMLSPLLLGIAILIKLDSHGPIYYRGKRVGRYGKPFRIYKFRSMHINAEQLGTTTAKNDPRITRVGGYLRKYKLDELPQLFNVLSGEMSLVGPRPEVEEHTNDYTAEEQAILSVLPGITDYSSIHFYNLGELLGSENPHQVYLTTIRAQKNQLRLQYIRNRSFGEDLRIIALTLARTVREINRRPHGV